MNRLSLIRKAFDATQFEFARFLGVSVPTIAKWESDPMLMRLCDIIRLEEIGVNIEYLLYGSGEILSGKAQLDVIKKAQKHE